jgi:membrane protease YdiL (CAAX protease family)
MEPIFLFADFITITAFIFRADIAGMIKRIKPNLHPIIAFLLSIPIIALLLSIPEDMKFKLENWWKTIVVTIIIICGAYVVWILWNFFALHSLPSPAPYGSYLILIAQQLVLAPIFEEIVQCALLSLAFVYSTNFLKSRGVIIGVNFIWLCFISIIIAYAHGDPNNLIYRSFGFVIYGAIYYFNERNLLPAIIAHSVWNLLVVIPI